MDFLKTIGIDNNDLSRMGNTVANTGKQASNQATARKLAQIEAEGGSEAEKAAYLLANVGAQTLIGKLAGDDEPQKIPDPYLGSEISTISKEFFKTSNQATSTYFSETKSGGFAYNTNHPIYKSLFLVDFEFNQEAINNSTLRSLMTSSFPRSMSFLLSNTTFPNVTIDTHKVNQYNKYVPKPTKVSFEPVTMSFTDIYANTKAGDKSSLLGFFKEYLSYFSNDVVNDKYGYHAGLNSDRSTMNLIKNIRFYFFWSTGAKVITMKNPFINSFKYSDLDYKEDDVLSLNMTFDYERVDVSSLELSLDDFVDQTAHLMNEVIAGYDPNFPSDAESNLNSSLLKPAPSDFLDDEQRDIGLDNPVAQIMLRLAEVEAMKAFGEDLNSDDPLKNAVANGAFSIGKDVLGGATSSAISAVRGFF